jgi:hypothetical protein
MQGHYFKLPKSPILLDLILKCVTILTVVVGAATVYIALRNNSRQLGAQIFLSYSDRMHMLRQTTSTDFDAYLIGDEKMGPIGSEMKRAIATAYIVIFEFYSLRRRGFIATPIWSIWEVDISRVLNSPAFRNEWPEASRRFDRHPRFLSWVDERRNAP